MNDIKSIKCDVVIVGTGVSGLYTALNLREDLNIVMITKSTIKESNSYLTQGGIAVARGEDDVEVHIQDTLKAGKYINDVNAVRVLVEESRQAVDSLIAMGVKLDREQNGDLLYTKEAAHSINRIVHVKDETGKYVIDTLVDLVKQKKNISIMENTKLCDIIHEENKAKGIIALEDDKEINIYAKEIILATGGIGGLFRSSTNKRHITGDGIAVAAKDNIKLKNLEYVQFHPTGLYEPNNTDKNKFLISESVRGEGGLLKNINGERFVDELLPRDIVTDTILEEMEKTNSPYVYLDVTFLDSNYIKNRFPGIYGGCLERGIDITKEYIPVCPAQHYFMGGIEVDLNSKTSMENLFAVGETSCTGVHGANRLASNSVLEGLVFSKRAADYINKNIKNLDMPKTKEIRLDYNKLHESLKFQARDIFKEKLVKFRNELVNN
jgi:L-aspartate oxidase